jgi:hypothetical protein
LETKKPVPNAASCCSTTDGQTATQADIQARQTRQTGRQTRQTCLKSAMEGLATKKPVPEAASCCLKTRGRQTTAKADAHTHTHRDTLDKLEIGNRGLGNEGASARGGQLLLKHSQELRDVVLGNLGACGVLDFIRKAPVSVGGRGAKQACGEGQKEGCARKSDQEGKREALGKASRQREKREREGERERKRDGER